MKKVIIPPPKKRNSLDILQSRMEMREDTVTELEATSIEIILCE